MSDLPYTILHRFYVHADDTTQPEALHCERSGERMRPQCSWGNSSVSTWRTMAASVSAPYPSRLEADLRALALARADALS